MMSDTSIYAIGVGGGLVFLFILSKSIDFQQKRVQAPIIAAREAEAARRAAELAAENVDPLPTYDPDLPEEVRVEMEDLEARGIGEVGPIQQDWQQQQLERTLTTLRIISTLPPPPEYTPNESAQGEETGMDGIVVETPAASSPQETTEEQAGERSRSHGAGDNTTDSPSDGQVPTSSIDSPDPPPLPRYSSEQANRPVMLLTCDLESRQLELQQTA